MSSNKKSLTSAKPERKQRGQVDRTVMFPVAPPKIELPEDYPNWLADLKQRIQSERLRIVITSNAAMILLYWDIGQRILEKQKAQGWGAKIIDRLSFDLHEQFPEMRGFSPRNLKYIRAFAAAWPNHEIVQKALAQLSWHQNLVLLQKLKSTEQLSSYITTSRFRSCSPNI
jgi:predicted nuclease of restriction endonuclease-like (RecB) superfamily